MKEINPVLGKIKHKVEDFIVEEVGEKWICRTGTKFESKKPDLSNLEKRDSEFIWCELEKYDLDHFSAIKELSQSLRKGNGAIGYAGTKDKKAYAAQRISIFKPDLEKISNFLHPKIYLKNFKWAKRKIKLGYLESNNFKVTIRDVGKKDSIKIAKSIRGTPWFPNYFGSQRFGSIRKNNVKIGKLILKRKFKEAVLTILTDISKDERPDIRFARERLRKEINFEEATKYFPRELRQEIRILNYLSRKKEDYLGAIKDAERKGILMYVHAVQSHIFNEILTKALEEGIDFTKEGQRNCILPGYKTHFFEGRLGEIERQVLGENGLELKDFDIREIPYLRIKGAYRKAITEVKNLNVEIEEDEEFEGSKKIIISFNLPSGVYATTYLENFFIFNN